MNQISNILFNNPEIQKITPIANAGGPYLVTKGSEIILDGTKSHASRFPVKGLLFHGSGILIKMEYLMMPLDLLLQ